MSATPARGSRSVDEDRLLALARALPTPVLSDTRREEMRTAFLSAVRGLKSGPRPRLARPPWRRLMVTAALVLAGAAAAATWHRRPNEIRLAPSAVVETGAPRPAAVPAAPPEETTVAAVVTPGRPALSRPRRMAVQTRRGARERDPGGDVELAFARGWSALRTGDFTGAAEAFAHASASKDDALAEDAFFWRGVALDRAARFTDARAVLAEFLARYSVSDRRGEASVILGWLLLRSGEADAARIRFAAALGDPVERIRNSARTGLMAVSSPR